MAYAAEDACSKGCDCEVIDAMVVSAAFRIVSNWYWACERIENG